VSDNLKEKRTEVSPNFGKNTDEVERSVVIEWLKTHLRNVFLCY